LPATDGVNVGHLHSLPSNHFQSCSLPVLTRGGDLHDAKLRAG
jgi:hypothetical protein